VGVAAPGFNYAEVGEDVAHQLRTLAARVRRFQTTAIAEVGRCLSAAKEAIGHGGFEAWLNAEFAMSVRSAENYMSAAKFLAGKSATVAYLPPSALYALAAPSADEHVIAAVLEEVEGGKVLSANEVRERLNAAAKERKLAEAQVRKTAEEIRKGKEAEQRRRRAEKAREEKWRADQQAQEAERNKAARTAATFLFDKLSPEDIATLLKIMKPTDFWKVTRFFIPHNYLGDAVGISDGASVVANFREHMAEVAR
jgi:hypothetical protein